MSSKRAEQEAVSEKELYATLESRILAIPPEDFTVTTVDPNSLFPHQEKYIGEMYTITIGGFTVSLSYHDPMYGAGVVHTLKIQEGKREILSYHEDSRDRDEKLRPYKVGVLYNKVRSRICEMNESKKLLDQQKEVERIEQERQDSIQRFAGLL